MVILHLIVGHVNMMKNMTLVPSSLVLPELFLLVVTIVGVQIIHPTIVSKDGMIKIITVHLLLLDKHTVMMNIEVNYVYHQISPEKVLHVHDGSLFIVDSSAIGNMASISMAS